MQSHSRNSHFIEDFLSQFEPRKQNSVVESLIILGIDLANKTGIRNPQDLQKLLKQLSKNIQESNQGDIRSEIKTIQKQLRDLNDFIQESHRDAWSTQGTVHKQKQPQKKMKKHTIDEHEIRNNNQYEYQNTYPTQRSQSKSPVQYQNRTPNKLKQSRSHSQRNLTPKITESPPPPQIVYINKMNNKFDIKPQFDDRQIKKLLYGENKATDRGRYFGQKNPSPQQLFYSSQTSGGMSSRQQQPSHQEFFHNVEKINNNLSPKKLPAYLQNVESKIKFLLDEAKQKYKEQQKDRERNMQDVNIRDSNQLQQQNSAETDTFFDIQQYIQDQKKYQFSPVQEMNDDERNENMNDEASETYSNFTPPDDEVKEFFQQQYLMQQRNK